MTLRTGVVVCLGIGLLGVSKLANAGIYGVPFPYNADGTIPAGTANPPGSLMMYGTAVTVPAGDELHQARFFIEVTGTTLDVRVFDPGDTGARDEGGTTTYTYTLFSPAGAALSTVTIGNDVPGTTENRVGRFSSANAFTSLSGGTPFTVTPGLYELRVTAGGGSSSNGYGIDIRSGTALAAPHYNVYSFGRDDHNAGTVVATDTGFVTGEGTTPGADITVPFVLDAYVNRGCEFQTQNFDSDTDVSANITDVLGATTALTLSGNAVAGGVPAPHLEDTIGIHTSGLANGVQTIVYNYGIYPLENSTSASGTVANRVEWRATDFRGWADNPAVNSRNPTDPIRLYLPNGYTAAGRANSTPAQEPVLTALYRIVSGPNPPVVGSATRIEVSTVLTNPGPAPITLNRANDQIVSGLPPTGVSGLGNIQCIDGETSAAIGAPVNGGTFARCNFSGAGVTIPVGETVVLIYQYNFTPPAPGVFFVTNPPAAPAAGEYNAGALAPNSTTWAQYTKFATGTPVAETLGPICDLRIDTTVLTRASIRGLSFDGSTLQFVTGSQKNTLAFNVYGVSDEKGFGRRVRLNTEPIRASLPDSLAPSSYAVGIAQPAPFVLIEEIETTGRTRLMGPFSLSDTHLKQAFARSQDTLQRIESERFGRGTRESRRADRAAIASASAIAPAAATTASTLRIEVEDAGRVVIPAAQINAAGIPPSVPLSSLRLTQLGSPVPFAVTTDAGGQPAIAFANRGLSTAYTGTNAFILTTAAQPAPAAKTTLTYWQGPVAAGVTRIEKPSFYAPGAPQGANPWIWDFLLSDPGVWPSPSTTPGIADFDLPRLNLAARGLVSVKVRLTGVSTHKHSVQAFINGQPVGTVAFYGQGSMVLKGAIAATSLRRTGNTLSLRYAAAGGDTGVFGTVYLNSMDIAAPLTGETIVAPSRIAALRPIAATPIAGLQYLIVTHPAFAAQAQSLASLKRSAGFVTSVADTESIYDRYSGGIVEAQAIAAFIKDQAKAATLRYVLLLGDDTFDTQDFLGTSLSEFVPSLYSWDGEFGRVPSENLYADVNQDGRPDLAIGRLPAQTADQAEALVAKVSRQSTRVPGTKHLMAIDNQLAGEPAFDANARGATTLFPAGSTFTYARVADGVATARQTLLSSLRTGAETTSFFGHGGFDEWTDEGLLTAADAASLEGSPSESVVFAWACESQWYQSPFGPSLGESLLNLRVGGAAAAFGPAGITSGEVHRNLSNGVYRNAFTPGVTLGEAIRKAKSDAIAQRLSGAQLLAHGWNLLGDPSLKLRP